MNHYISVIEEPRTEGFPEKSRLAVYDAESLECLNSEEVYSVAGFTELQGSLYGTRGASPNEDDVLINLENGQTSPIEECKPVSIESHDGKLFVSGIDLPYEDKVPASGYTLPGIIADSEDNMKDEGVGIFPHALTDLGEDLLYVAGEDADQIRNLEGEIVGRASGHISNLANDGEDLYSIRVNSGDQEAEVTRLEDDFSHESLFGIEEGIPISMEASKGNVWVGVNHPQEQQDRILVDGEEEFETGENVAQIEEISEETVEELL